MKDRALDLGMDDWEWIYVFAGCPLGAIAAQTRLSSINSPSLTTSVAIWGMSGEREMTACYRELPGAPMPRISRYMYAVTSTLWPLAN